ncbi:MAG: RNA-splicing ligase RtcB [Candidatus Buchananbacteria bacterium RBG_13_36_9]|uniref:tRNA-splicing ligase RtcB n=1 Tax=Candidatus Buchananbacteria bacterium RBG_13_36_9 TaxID=1797530 RepID=A0A1G1XQ36_9BACT|nr:MAG: RNA-splicing ligase RtcB [Candidatus Buchananbacteria bacterium RBG_13_36_9]
MITKQNLKKISDYIYEIPQDFRHDMKVPARIYTDDKMLEAILSDLSLEQAVNVATLPGILKYSLAMPDIHQGYGFPIGGVAAIKWEGGVISPGGVGYDINCGVRLLTSQITHLELQPKFEHLIDSLFRTIPSGVGHGGQLIVSKKEIDEVLTEGLDWAVKKGFASKEDKENCEENGRIREADCTKVSETAKKRGQDQIGTLGSGNHFLEIQYVAQIFNEEIAKTFDLFPNQIVVMIHTGSRGLGHQTCTDYLRQLNRKIQEWKLKLPDRELIYAPLDSKEGQDYFSAMSAAANFAWANRQYLTYLTRRMFKEELGQFGDKIDLRLIYDVAHNIAKKETYEIDGKKVEVCMHRKGATRAFGPDNPNIPVKYKKTGQPVIIPGSMGTSSYVLAGTKKAEAETFASVCHGAGRSLSRSAAKRQVTGKEIKERLEKREILVRCASYSGIAEEAPEAYKDIDSVVNIVAKAGLAIKVAKMLPLGVVKG